MRRQRLPFATILGLTFALAISVSALTIAQQQALVRPTSTLVWQGAKVDPGGSVSSDGRYLSFTDWETGDLMLHDLVSGANRTIVAANNAKGGRLKVGAETSTISPNGRQVAYSWWDETKDEYELRVASLVGEAKPRTLQVAYSVVPRDWSPDGRWLATLLSSKDSADQLALIPVNGGQARILKSGHWSGRPRVFFSPDGKYLAYDLPQGALNNRDVWVTAADGTSDARVVAHRANDVAMGWSPDGKYVLFTSDRSGTIALFALALQDGKSAGTPVALKPDMGDTQSIGVTKAGALYWATVADRRGGSIQVAAFDLASGAVTSPRDISENPQEENVNPLWSPDGKHLAYVSGRSNAPRAIQVPRTVVVRSAATGGLEREVETRLEGAELAGWEPNSQALLVVGSDPTGRRGSFRLNLETGEISFIFATPESPALSFPTWSLDGRTLYYWNRVNEDMEHVFVARNMASGAERELVRRAFLGALMLSPDGRFLVTETADRKTNERVILLVPTDGGAARDLMRIPSGVTGNDLSRVNRGARLAPAFWAPDGQSVIARQQREPEGPSELWQVPINTEPARKLPSVLQANVFAFRISPDGRRVAYRVKESEPTLPKQLWKFEHFLPPIAP
jgi:Tol biopolymer transport system component